MRYCSSCILPDTRPGIEIDANGVCNACTFARRKREEIDWEAREREFVSLVEKVKRRKARYDCIIPVSGGKDSHWQTITCLKYDLHPLLVTWKPPIRTELGEANLNNLISLGADHIDFTVDPEVHRRFTLASWRKDGTAGVPMHLAIHNITHTLAESLKVPLVVWGENSAEEYGSLQDQFEGKNISDEWLETFNTKGTLAKDWVGKGFTAQELTPYFGPSSVSQNSFEAVFLGYYFAWDPQNSREVALTRGFKEGSGEALTGYYKYADLDDPLIAVHHWLKWYKFGFTRSFDNLSLEIRAGRMTRAEAVSAIRERGDETPRDAISIFCRYLDISHDDFAAIVASFRNLEVWQKVGVRWEIPGFIVSDWTWHEDSREEASARV